MPSDHKAYRTFLAIAGILMFGWGIAYGFETYRYNECSETARVRINKMNAQIDEARKSLEQKK